MEINMTVKEQKQYYESNAFREKYMYTGDDLGASCDENRTQFKLWSPLADSITLNLYFNRTDAAFQSISMEKQEKGVWVYQTSQSYHGVYYDYTIEIDGKKQLSADPYAKACACNGERSMVVDLSLTNPDGWEQDKAPQKTDEQIVYELHVKDFSHDPASGIPKQYRGKYKAFTFTGTTLNGDGIHPTGVDYLKNLGITHVQLMPIFDYGSVNEEKSEEEYNWGYDPLNYNVPEGSYATDPFLGEVRIRELKEAILSLHKNGLRVIMDVVYNHTYHVDSWLNRTVPNYFYRQFEDGTYCNGSQCGNDIATEREMCSKYILDSVLYWAREYHMDGFRFDLMGLMNVSLLNRIRKALDKEFGENEILLYGEPWSAGDSPMAEGELPCKKNNMKYLDEHVGVFSDSTRDSIKGHVFDNQIPGFVNGGKGLEETILCDVRAWQKADANFPVKAPSQIINYISAHDNLTLWDKLVVSMKPQLSFLEKDKEILRAYKMAAAVNFTCQGRLFLLAGEEAARTKLGDENSYISSPSINQLDWKRMYEYENLIEYYRGLIALRKQLPGLWDKTANAVNHIVDEKIPMDGVVQFSVKNEKTAKWSQLAIWYNNTNNIQKLALPEGEWQILLDETSSFLWKMQEIVSGQQEISPVSVKIFGKRSL